jgi:hypothetical protein
LPAAAWAQSAATYQVQPRKQAVIAAWLRIVSCSIPPQTSCRTSQVQARARGRAKAAQRHASSYARIRTQHCMSAGSHTPSLHPSTLPIRREVHLHVQMASVPTILPDVWVHCDFSRAHKQEYAIVGKVGREAR